MLLENSWPEIKIADFFLTFWYPAISYQNHELWWCDNEQQNFNFYDTRYRKCPYVYSHQQSHYTIISLRGYVNDGIAPNTRYNTHLYGAWYSSCPFMWISRRLFVWNRAPHVSTGHTLLAGRSCNFWWVFRLYTVVKRRPQPSIVHWNISKQALKLVKIRIVSDFYS